MSIVAGRCASQSGGVYETRRYTTGGRNNRREVEGERRSHEEEAVKLTTATIDRGRAGSSPNPGAILFVSRARGVLLPFSLRDLGTIFIRNVCVFSPLARPCRPPLLAFCPETPLPL